MPVTASVTGGARAELPQLLKGSFCLERTVLYCTVLYCTVLYCTVLYCLILFAIFIFFSHFILTYFFSFCYVTGVKVSERASNFDGHLRLGIV